MESKYNIANTLTEWLGYWKYPELKHNIISTSKSIYSHRKYAKPDNAFQFCICDNAYQFLTNGLKLDVDCIPYCEDENVYWNILASKIDIANFRFEKFFNEEDIKINGTYEETWKYVQQGLNSLLRGSNFWICINNHKS